jgi:hypothetical protein
MAARSKTALPAPAAEPAVPAQPWGEKSLGEKMQAASHLGLDVLQQVLSAPVDLADLKLLKLQVTAAVSVISQTIRVEAEQMRGPNPRVEAERERLLHEMRVREFGDGSDRGKPG